MTPWHPVVKGGHPEVHFGHMLGASCVACIKIFWYMPQPCNGRCLHYSHKMNSDSKDVWKGAKYGCFPFLFLKESICVLSDSIHSNLAGGTALCRTELQPVTFSWGASSFYELFLQEFGGYVVHRWGSDSKFTSDNLLQSRSVPPCREHSRRSMWAVSYFYGRQQLVEPDALGIVPTCLSSLWTALSWVMFKGL